VSDTLEATTQAERPVTSPRLVRPLWTRLVRWAVFAAAIAVLAYVPLVATRPWLRAGEYVMIGVVGAIGLTLLTGQAGQLSLAHGFFLLTGGVAYVVLTSPGDADHIGFGLTPIIGLLGSVVLSALLGLAFAPVAGRLRGIYLGVASLSLVFVGLYLGQSLPALAGTTARGRDPVPFSVFGFSFGEPATPSFTLLGVPLGGTERLWYLFLVLALASWALAAAAVRGRPGRAWRAVRDNEAAASVLGVSVVRAKAGAFAVSSGYAGLAGAMTVLWFEILKPDESEYGTYGINISIAFLAMIIVGGLGSVAGAAVGAALVFGLPQVLTLTASGSGAFSGTGGGAITPVILTQFIYGAAIIAVVMFEPGGLAAIGRRVGSVLSRHGREGGTP
jgi:branched-chain amino acid transport system permease protein